MKLTLDALQVVDAIDRRGSFAAAAADLNRVPSALTYTVRKLEDDLDVLLFDRSGHKAKLTPAGRELLDSGRQLLRAVNETEQRVKRVASGWETALRIALDTIFPLSALHPLMENFYAQGHSTQLRFTQEVLGGSWEALQTGRADLVIGAPGPAPSAFDCKAQKLGELRMVFAVAASHPLSKIKCALTDDDVRPYRGVAVADSSRYLLPRSYGIVEGQSVLTVYSMQEKLDAQRLGLGVGYLPYAWAATHLASGSLIEKSRSGPRELATVYLLTQKKAQGKAIKWWQEQLAGSRCLQHWLM